MSLNKLNIPKKIVVGFQNRSDTYTKKLAYVIYRDNKDVLRKEKSWQSWRDKNIDSVEFDNVPTEGFVLNKKVGGYKSGWDVRQAYIRVYDPRDFEFEITVANLLFILEECSSIKGKGIEGKFVYAWDGTELVLLPAESQEYKSSTDFTVLQTQKVSKSDIKEGGLYRTKDNDEVMYLGRHLWSEYDYSYTRSTLGYDYTYGVTTKKKHIFVDIKNKNYLLFDGFTKIGTVISSDCQDNFADEFDKLKKDKHYGDDFSLQINSFNLLPLFEEQEKRKEEDYSVERWGRYGEDYRQQQINNVSLGFLDKSTNKTLYIQKRLKQYGTNESSIIYELVDGEKSYVFNVDNCSLSYNYKYVSNSSRKQITREDIALMTGIKVYVVNNSNKKTLKEVV